MIKRGCLLLLAMVFAGCGGGDRVIVGAGTTTVDSGFMEALEREYGRDISVVAGSTAELLELAAQGAVDVVLVHDERQELEYVANNPAAVRAPAFESSFLLVGPTELAAAISTESAFGAMAEIAAVGHTFVTRDDGSGTHSRELALWEGADVAPGGAWYVATGQGMGLTLQVADQLGGFTLVETGVFLQAADTIDLVQVPVIDPRELSNPYSVIKVSDSGGPFFTWLAGEAGASAVAAASEAVFGGPIYSARARP